jgi:hypothetical protein
MSFEIYDEVYNTTYEQPENNQQNDKNDCKSDKYECKYSTMLKNIIRTGTILTINGLVAFMYIYTALVLSNDYTINPFIILSAINLYWLRYLSGRQSTLKNVVFDFVLLCTFILVFSASSIIIQKGRNSMLLITDAIDEVNIEARQIEVYYDFTPNDYKKFHDEHIESGMTEVAICNKVYQNSVFCENAVEINDEYIFITYTMLFMNIIRYVCIISLFVYNIHFIINCF